MSEEGSQGDQLGSAESITGVQYEQTAESLRNHDRLLWQTPSVAAAVNSGILLVAFRFVSNRLVRSALLFIGLLLTASLLVALIKHRYFMVVETQTLYAIEEILGANHVQRTTHPRAEMDYWTEAEPERLQSLSAAKALIWGMGLSVVILAVLLGYSILP